MAIPVLGKKAYFIEFLLLMYKLVSVICILTNECGIYVAHGYLQYVTVQWTINTYRSVSHQSFGIRIVYNKRSPLYQQG